MAGLGRPVTAEGAAQPGWQLGNLQIPMLRYEGRHVYLDATAMPRTAPVAAVGGDAVLWS